MAGPFALLMLAALPADETKAPGDLPSALRRFMEVYAKVEAVAAERVDPEKAIYGGAIPGMLRRLDPHSVFFDPQQFEQLKELERSTRKGFGTIVSVLPGRVIVLQALPGTPSARAGILPGDEILAINDISLDRLDLDQLIALLGESRQRPAKLDVRRPGATGILTLTLTPEEMQSPSVERAFHVAPGVGYLRVTSFDANTGREVREAIEKLGGRQLKGLVLDLRNNPGGMLPSALETAALFLPPGSRLLTARGRAVGPREEKVPEDARPYDFPLAVLINGRSASAAEIVAGALQDHGRAAIVGEPSFGKGLVETVYPLSDNTGLALTTAYYYTPKGRSIQRPLPGTPLQPAGVGGPTAVGGIQPDRLVYPEAMTPFRTIVEASGAFTSFATEFTRRREVREPFEITPAVLDEFQAYLAERKIQPSVTEWVREREWISVRLKTEILNQALGVDKGDQVELAADPVVRAALRALGAG
ncbi:MAG: S41 family peptidase [Bryobacterales bacterium]|nr:S41 family peptidase [Bryobacteraceae bacterium]MDW8129548.1 S41 family peptidase [Bryobacterales bacterium]